MIKKIIFGTIILLFVNQIFGAGFSHAIPSSNLNNNTNNEVEERVVYKHDITVAKTGDIFKYHDEEEVLTINTKMLKRKIFRTVKTIKDGFSNFFYELEKNSN